ncbi:hypothetical protein MBLNU459_g2673t1 [Dothideomycetes sp. NU459]
MIYRQSLSVAPKRAPLSGIAPVQHNVNLGDMIGSASGKENIPPNTYQPHIESEGKRLSKKSPPVPTQANDSHLAGLSLPAKRSSVYKQSTTTSQTKVAAIKKRPISDIKEDNRKFKVPVTKDLRPMVKTRDRIFDKHAGSQTSSPNCLTRQVPAKLNIPSVHSSVGANLPRYPVLPEDLDQPQLYEDNWLSHQETALTQLVNGVFQQAEHSLHLPRDNSASLRGKLVTLYRDPAVATLHKRLKASLLYGALSLPKDAPGPTRLIEDIGLRRQFLDLWLQSYDLDALRAAVEVVVGRVIAPMSRDATTIAQSLGSNSGTSESPKAKELRRFLLTFLVHHEDAVNVPTQQIKILSTQISGEESTFKVGTPEWHWQKTVLQGFMVIYLLDNAKSSGIISDCLFQHTSIRKSSLSFLQAFARMVIPSVGDITRPLGHLDYRPMHVQHPLEEYIYRIDNIAVDLRNGVLLTRFVELLLYPSLSSSSRQDCALSLSLPDGETLYSATDNERNDSWILSQHLKFPCLGRTPKLHNVQIALSALASVHDKLTSSAIENITASDIVDGHREKTLSLLWALVNRWGMSLLIDWDELKKETCRFTPEPPTEHHNDGGDCQSEADMLTSWAAAICAPHGLHITNLTTSFSGGAALGIIVHAYADYLPASKRSAPSRSGHHVAHSSSDSAWSVAATLKALNCSTAFVSLFTSIASPIPSRTTIISLLAFLASRLLPLARAHRAAQRIQRVWRLRLLRRNVSRRVACMVLAAQCAEVVRCKERIVDAAVVLQRGWRRVLDRRIRGLETDVVCFQAVARAWAVRRVLVAGAGARGRVRGGW